MMENTNERAGQYRYATVLYLLASFAHTYSTIIDHGVGGQGNFREVVDGLNATDTTFISILMMTLELPGASVYAKHMVIYTLTANKDISILREFQKHNL